MGRKRTFLPDLAKVRFGWKGEITTSPHWLWLVSPETALEPGN